MCVCICVEGRSAIQYITIVPRISLHVNYRLFINVSAIKFQVPVHTIFPVGFTTMVANEGPTEGKAWSPRTDS